ncbi:MAG: hypothetical protein KGI79_00050 [Patescibacteria group bacterium]|nr:hypothetical protein [Patescibacteria group bacterium]MDE2116262.1 hypothetical protein [Patescibacteria group bacterium]
MQIILYILAAMIFWDLSIHVIELFGKAEKFSKSRSVLSYYYPHLYWKKTKAGPVVRENWQRLYQRFWVTYWGTAFVLIIVYMLIR